jgi:sirohydrochlorin cobaltochelatase
MKDAALILVGHGSVHHPDGAAPVLALADSISARGVFGQVLAGFMKQAPSLAQARAAATMPRVVVVPVFAGKGYYTDRLIPDAFGLSGPVTEQDGRRFFYTDPVGSHPRLPALLASRAAKAAQGAGMAACAASLLLIAHGSSRPGGAGDTPRAIAAAIAAMGTFVDVGLVFLEQEPFADRWRDAVAGPDVVTLPLLVAQGMHASRDIPPLFGLGVGERGPVTVDGRRVVLATGIGAEPDLVELILEMAGQSLAGA